MVTSKKILFSVILMTLLQYVSPETALSSTPQEQFASETFQIRGIPTLNIRPGQGSITVIGTDENRVRVEIYATRRGLAILGGDKISDDYRVVFRQRGNEVTAEVVGRRGGAWSSNAPSFNIVVYTPYRSNGTLLTSAGDVSVENINGNLDIRNSAGNITLTGGKGQARLSSASGSISVKEHEGKVFANVLAGDVIMNDVEGEIRLRVVAGNALLDKMFGSFIIHVTNGNINFLANRIDELVDLESVLGNINVQIPGQGGLDLNVSGSDVNVGLITNFAGDIRRNSINGKFNGGGTPIRIKTTSGKVDLIINQNRSNN